MIGTGRTRRALTVAAAMCTSAALAGCGSDEPDRSTQPTETTSGPAETASTTPTEEPDALEGELLVLAAASLTDVLHRDLTATFEAEHPGVDVVLSFGASSELATSRGRRP